MFKRKNTARKSFPDRFNCNKLDSHPSTELISDHHHEKSSVNSSHHSEIEVLSNSQSHLSPKSDSKISPNKYSQKHMDSEHKLIYDYEHGKRHHSENPTRSSYLKNHSPRAVKTSEIFGGRFQQPRWERNPKHSAGQSFSSNRDDVDKHRINHHREDEESYRRTGKYSHVGENRVRLSDRFEPGKSDRKRSADYRDQHSIHSYNHKRSRPDSFPYHNEVHRRSQSSDNLTLQGSFKGRDKEHTKVELGSKASSAKHSASDDGEDVHITSASLQSNILSPSTHVTFSNKESGEGCSKSFVDKKRNSTRRKVIIVQKDKPSPKTEEEKTSENKPASDGFQNLASSSVETPLSFQPTAILSSKGTVSKESNQNVFKAAETNTQKTTGQTVQTHMGSKINTLPAAPQVGINAPSKHSSCSRRLLSEGTESNDSQLNTRNSLNETSSDAKNSRLSYDSKNSGVPGSSSQVQCKHDMKKSSESKTGKTVSFTGSASGETPLSQIVGHSSQCNSKRNSMETKSELHQDRRSSSDTQSSHTSSSLDKEISVRSLTEKVKRSGSFDQKSSEMRSMHDKYKLNQTSEAKSKSSMASEHLSHKKQPNQTDAVKHQEVKLKKSEPASELRCQKVKESSPPSQTQPLQIKNDQIKKSSEAKIKKPVPLSERINYNESHSSTETLFSSELIDLERKLPGAKKAASVLPSRHSITEDKQPSETQLVRGKSDSFIKSSAAKGEKSKCSSFNETHPCEIQPVKDKHNKHRITETKMPLVSENRNNEKQPEKHDSGKQSEAKFKKSDLPDKHSSCTSAQSSSLMKNKTEKKDAAGKSQFRENFKSGSFSEHINQQNKQKLEQSKKAEKVIESEKKTKESDPSTELKIENSKRSSDNIFSAIAMHAFQSTMESLNGTDNHATAKSKLHGKSEKLLKCQDVKSNRVETSVKPSSLKRKRSGSESENEKNTFQNKKIASEKLIEIKENVCSKEMTNKSAKSKGQKMRKASGEKSEEELIRYWKQAEWKSAPRSDVSSSDYESEVSQNSKKKKSMKNSKSVVDKALCSSKYDTPDSTCDISSTEECRATIDENRNVFQDIFGVKDDCIQICHTSKSSAGITKMKNQPTSECNEVNRIVSSNKTTKAKLLDREPTSSSGKSKSISSRFSAEKECTKQNKTTQKSRKSIDCLGSQQKTVTEPLSVNPGDENSLPKSKDILQTEQFQIQKEKDINESLRSPEKFSTKKSVTTSNENESVENLPTIKYSSKRISQLPISGTKDCTNTSTGSDEVTKSSQQLPSSPSSSEPRKPRDPKELTSDNLDNGSSDVSDSNSIAVDDSCNGNMNELDAVQETYLDKVYAMSLNNSYDISQCSDALSDDDDEEIKSYYSTVKVSKTSNSSCTDRDRGDNVLDVSLENNQSEANKSTDETKFQETNKARSDAKSSATNKHVHKFKSSGAHTSSDETTSEQTNKSTDVAKSAETHKSTDESKFPSTNISADETKCTETITSTNETDSTETNRSANEAKSTETNTSTDEAKSLEGKKSTDETASLDAKKSTDELASLEAKKSTDGLVSLEAKKSTDELASLEAKKSTDELASLEAKKSTDESSSLEAKKSTDETASLEAKKSTDQPAALEAKKPTDELASSEAKKSTDEPASLEVKKSTDKPASLEAKKSTIEPTSLEAKKATDELASLEAKKSSDEPTSLEAKKSTDEPASLEAKKSTDEPTSSEVKKSADGLAFLEAKQDETTSSEAKNKAKAALKNELCDSASSSSENCVDKNVLDTKNEGIIYKVHDESLDRECTSKSVEITDDNREGSCRDDKGVSGIESTVTTDNSRHGISHSTNDIADLASTSIASQIHESPSSNVDSDEMKCREMVSPVPDITKVDDDDDDDLEIVTIKNMDFSLCFSSLKDSSIHQDNTETDDTLIENINKLVGNESDEMERENSTDSQPNVLTQLNNILNAGNVENVQEDCFCVDATSIFDQIKSLKKEEEEPSGENESGGDLSYSDKCHEQPSDPLNRYGVDLCSEADIPSENGSIVVATDHMEASATSVNNTTNITTDMNVEMTPNIKRTPRNDDGIVVPSVSKDSELIVSERETEKDCDNTLPLSNKGNDIDVNSNSSFLHEKHNSLFVNNRIGASEEKDSAGHKVDKTPPVETACEMTHSKNNSTSHVSSEDSATTVLRSPSQTGKQSQNTKKKLETIDSGNKTSAGNNLESTTASCEKDTNSPVAEGITDTQISHRSNKIPVDERVVLRSEGDSTANMTSKDGSIDVNNCESVDRKSNNSSIMAKENCIASQDQDKNINSVSRSAFEVLHNIKELVQQTGKKGDQSADGSSMPSNMMDYFKHLIQPSGQIKDGVLNLQENNENQTLTKRAVASELSSTLDNQELLKNADCTVNSAASQYQTPSRLRVSPTRRENTSDELSNVPPNIMCVSDSHPLERASEVDSCESVRKLKETGYSQTDTVTNSDSNCEVNEAEYRTSDFSNDLNPQKTSNPPITLSDTDESSSQPTRQFADTVNSDGRDCQSDGEFNFSTNVSSPAIRIKQEKISPEKSSLSTQELSHSETGNVTLQTVKTEINNENQQAHDTPGNPSESSPAPSGTSPILVNNSDETSQIVDTHSEDFAIPFLYTKPYLFDRSGGLQQKPVLVSAVLKGNQQSPIIYCNVCQQDFSALALYYLHSDITDASRVAPVLEDIPRLYPNYILKNDGEIKAWTKLLEATKQLENYFSTMRDKYAKEKNKSMSQRSLSFPGTNPIQNQQPSIHTNQHQQENRRPSADEIRPSKEAGNLALGNVDKTITSTRQSAATSKCLIGNKELDSVSQQQISCQNHASLSTAQSVTSKNMGSGIQCIGSGNGINNSCNATKQRSSLQPLPDKSNLNISQNPSSHKGTKVNKQSGVNRLPPATSYVPRPSLPITSPVSEVAATCLPVGGSVSNATYRANKETESSCRSAPAVNPVRQGMLLKTSTCANPNQTANTSSSSLNQFQVPYEHQKTVTSQQQMPNAESGNTVRFKDGHQKLFMNPHQRMQIPMKPPTRLNAQSASYPLSTIHQPPSTNNLDRQQHVNPSMQSEIQSLFVNSTLNSLQLNQIPSQQRTQMSTDRNPMTGDRTSFSNADRASSSATLSSLTNPNYQNYQQNSQNLGHGNYESISPPNVQEAAQSSLNPQMIFQQFQQPSQCQRGPATHDPMSQTSIPVSSSSQTSDTRQQPKCQIKSFKDAMELWNKVQRIRKYLVQVEDQVQEYLSDVFPKTSSVLLQMSADLEQEKQKNQSLQEIVHQLSRDSGNNPLQNPSASVQQLRRDSGNNQLQNTSAHQLSELGQQLRTDPITNQLQNPSIQQWNPVTSWLPDNS